MSYITSVKDSYVCIPAETQHAHSLHFGLHDIVIFIVTAAAFNCGKDGRKVANGRGITTTQTTEKKMAEVLCPSIHW